MLHIISLLSYAIFRWRQRSMRRVPSNLRNEAPEKASLPEASLRRQREVSEVNRKRAWNFIRLLGGHAEGFSIGGT